MVTYPLDEVLVATLVGVVCGADDWEGVYADKQSGLLRDADGRFAPGTAPGRRPVGVPNKTTRLLREAVIMAAELEGQDMGAAEGEGLIEYLRPPEPIREEVVRWASRPSNANSVELVPGPRDLQARGHRNGVSRYRCSAR
jgi:hypothetical protein